MISVIIPNYKNQDQLIQNHEHNLKYLQNCQIIIVNDDPSTSLQKNLSQFKNIVLVENKKNLGFGQSINEGVKKARGQYLMLLNSDVILNDQNYLLALTHFKDQKVFAVSFAQKEKDNSTVGKNIVYWQNGLYHHQKVLDLKLGDNGWAEGGSSIFDRKKFLSLGGFDPAYSPFYWEDVDLSYRARKAGYRVIFDPKVLVIHHHETTIGQYFTKEQIKVIAYRNQLIFTWKNLSGFKHIVQHLLFLPFLVIRHLLNGDYLFLIGCIKALLSDRQISTNLNQFKQKASVPDYRRHE